MKRFFILAAALALLLLCACAAPRASAPPETPQAQDGLTVYFIDVGQADAALVVSGGASMLIDGGNADDSDLIYAFLKGRGVSQLDYVVATHAHEDHVGGLPGALNYATADTALCPVTEYDSGVFEDFAAYLDRQNVSITVPLPGDTYTLGGASFTVLAPITASDEPNNTSLVLRLTYGETSFLFTGDAERTVEADMLEAGCDLRATVLKVGHHGSDTSTGYPFLREVMPQYAVISCGEDNAYGHPHDETLSRLRDAGVTLFRTDMQGTVTCTSDGKSVSFTAQRNAGAQTNPTQPETEAEYYIGNLNSRKFHRPDCSGLPDEHNRVTFETRGAAVSAGYDPCGSCKP